MPANYGNYTRQDFGKYVDDMIGDYSAQLEKNTFDDGRHTPYLEAVKYGADIVWYMYNTKQDQDHKLAIVNTDVLDVASSFSACTLRARSRRRTSATPPRLLCLR